MVEKKVLSFRKKVRMFITDWDNEHPLDLWWRKKYNIPFGSQLHRFQNFIDMRIEYEEDQLLKEFEEKKEKLEGKEFIEGSEKISVRNKGKSRLSDTDIMNSYLNDEDQEKVIQMTSDEINKEYENLDITKSFRKNIVKKKPKNYG